MKLGSYFFRNDSHSSWNLTLITDSRYKTVSTVIIVYKLLRYVRHRQHIRNCFIRILWCLQIYMVCLRINTETFKCIQAYSYFYCWHKSVNLSLFVSSIKPIFFIINNLSYKLVFTNIFLQQGKCHDFKL